MPFIPCLQGNSSLVFGDRGMRHAFGASYVKVEQLFYFVMADLPN